MDIRMPGVIPAVVSPFETNPAVEGGPVGGRMCNMHV